MVALLLCLLWQPAMIIGELSSQQNIIAVVVDDSRSMGIADSDGSTREAAAIAALDGGVLAGLAKRFRRASTGSTANSSGSEANSEGIAPTGTATHIDDGLKQLVADTSDLPVGAVLLLSDGGENTTGLGGSGIGADALQALRNRRLPVHTVGFGREELRTRCGDRRRQRGGQSAVANARVAATVSSDAAWLRGPEGDAHRARRRQDARCSAKSRSGPDGRIQTEPLFFPGRRRGRKEH